MAEPLDPDTLALGRDPKHLAVLDEALASTTTPWVSLAKEELAALLAVARDHARLTAQLDHYESDLAAARAGDEPRSDA